MCSSEPCPRSMRTIEINNVLFAVTLSTLENDKDLVFKVKSQGKVVMSFGTYTYTTPLVFYFDTKFLKKKYSINNNEDMEKFLMHDKTLFRMIMYPNSFCLECVVDENILRSNILYAKDTLPDDPDHPVMTWCGYNKSKIYI